MMPRLVAPMATGVASLREESRSTSARAAPQAWANTAAGVLCTIAAVAFAGAFGQLVFGGLPAPEMSRGVFAALVSTIVMLLVLPWRGAFSFSVGGPDSNPSAVLAVTLAAITQALAAGPAAPPEWLPTVLAYVSASAVIVGAMVWLLGAQRGGRCVRYVPYPVVGGFLAGSGYLLVSGACKVLTGHPPGVEMLASLRDVNPLAGGMALAVALALLVGTRWLRHYLVMPAVIVAAVAVFHLVVGLAGIDLAEARAQQLLLPPPAADSWGGVLNLPWSGVRWDLVLAHVDGIAAMTAVVVVTALMNTTSIEVATGRDGDADRELRAIGFGNMIAGLLGGMVASNSFNRTFLNFRAGATSAWVTRGCAAVIAGVMVFAPETIGLLPRPVLTGLILFLGISLLTTWVVEARRTLAATDYAIVLAILGVVAVRGIVAGVVLGIFIACVSFAVSMSRSRNVRQAFTGENHRSNVERTPEQLATLRGRGGVLRGFVLDGVLFFGTASRLLEEIRHSLAMTRLVLLDFRLVQGIDGSAIVVLKRVLSLCRESGAHLVVTGLKPHFEALLARGGFDFGAEQVRRFADLDRGLEWCEEQILGEGSAGAAELAETLGRVLGIEESRMLLAACERRRIVPGQVLVRHGEPSDEMFLIERGRVHVLLPVAPDGAAGTKRLRTYGPGTVVGEMGFYSGEPRSADVVAEEETEAFCLTRARLAEAEATHPKLAHALHRFVILSLSQRLRAANEEIGELM